MVFRIALYLLIGYTGLCLFMFFMQRRLLYMPSKRSLPTHLNQYELAPWPQEKDYLGLISTAHPNAAKGTILVLHGNAGSAVDRFFYADALTKLGYRVILSEYPGYGARPGNITQASLVSHAKNLVHQIQQSFSGPVYLWGESLGAGVAAATAGSKDISVDGLILLTPWYSLGELAQSMYWFLPVKWLLRDRYPSAHYLQNYRGPVAVILAERDTIIPIRHGQKLFDSLSTTKQRWIFKGADHNNWPFQPEAPWWQEVMQFMARSAP